VQQFRIHFHIAACVVFFAASGSAWAADCTKGLLWPYVRNPGDCLTDEEIRTGRIGIFTNTNSASPPNQTAPSGVSGTASTGTPPQSSAPTPAVSQTVSKPPAATPAATPAPAINTASCNKGLLWPFVRDSGDCPTAVEKKNGVAPAQVSTPAPVSTSNVSAPVPAASVSPAVAVAPSANASCSKGLFWPFVRDNGDCATAVQKKNGVAPAQISAPAPVSTPNPAPVQPASVAPAVLVAPGSNPASCSKGVLWPFVRDSGDCPTAAEKKNGAVAATPISATQPIAMPVSSAAPPASAAPATMPETAGNSAACHKGLFWPFVRSDGDCPTEADKTPARGQNRS
jgi:ribonuclease E